MYTWFRERRKVAGYRRAIAKADEAYDLEYQQVRKNPTPEKLHEVAFLRQSELQLYEDQISEIETSRLLRRAKRSGAVPPPKEPEGQYWFRSSQLGCWLLTDEGTADLLQKVRAEETRVRDGRIGWITAITGLLGAVIGVLSAWPKPPV